MKNVVQLKRELLPNSHRILPNKPDTRQQTMKSFPKILRRIAYPVEPFCLQFVQDRLALSLVDGIHDGFGKQTGYLSDSPATKFQCVHKWWRAVSYSIAPSSSSSGTVAKLVAESLMA
jgi:hypothetical protein